MAHGARCHAPALETMLGSARSAGATMSQRPYQHLNDTD